MMKNQDINNFYKKLVSKAIKSMNHECYNNAIDFIKSAAYIGYIHKGLFRDDKLEAAIKTISRKRSKVSDSSYTCSKKNENYFFYDAFSMDNRGLTQQYIRALIDNNINFTYCSENMNLKTTHIYTELIRYDKTFIHVIPSKLSPVEKIDYILHLLKKYKPSKIFMHLKPWSAEALIAVSQLPKNVLKYNINLTDHTFWLGSSVLNYNIEFRNYGCSLSVEKRNLKLNQLILIPYYPIIDDSTFQGFPMIPKNDNVILFAGANLYKIYGNNNEFLQTIKCILQENEKSYFLFAGGGDSRPFIKFVQDNNLQDRIFYLGFRKDINEVVKHIDIYIDTFPMSGGLMGEYALINKKPVLIYSPFRSTSFEPAGGLSLLFPEGELPYFTNKQDFLLKAKSLIENKNLRDEEGRKYYNLIPSRQEFALLFSQALAKDGSPKSITINQISAFKNSDTFIDNKITLDETYIIKFIGLKAFIINPIIMANSCFQYLMSFLYKISHKFLYEKYT